VRTHAGYDPEDITGHPVTDFYLNPEDRETFIEKLKETGAVNDYELKLKAKDGSVIETSMSAHIIIGNDGDATGVEGVLRDITERKRAEEALKESEEKYRDLVENLTEVIYSIDPSGKILYVSPAVKSLIGYAPKEIEGQSFTGLIHEDDLPQASKRIQKIFTGASVTGEYRIRAKSGQIKWIRTSSRPVFKGKQVTGLQGILTDITESKEAEKELKESEKKYRELIEKSLQGVIIIQDSRIVFTNKALAKITGFTVKELLSLTPERMKGLVHPEDQERVWGILKDRQEGKALAPQYEFRGIRKDGSIMWLEIFASQITFNGKAAIQEAIIDVTERKQAEEIHRANEERFRTMVETAPGMLMISDAKGNNIYISPNCEKLTGYTQEELQETMKWWVHKDDTPKARKVFEQTFQKGKGGKDFEYKAVKKNGDIWHASSTWEPLKDKKGHLLGVVMQTIDITERKKTEEALRESEEKYRAIFESINDVYFRTDRHGIVTLISPSVQTQAGWAPEEIIGKPVTDFYLNPDDHKKTMEKLNESGVINDYELRLLAKDGSVIETSANSSLMFDNKGRPMGLEGILRNITERKRTEEELQAREAYLDQLFESAQEAIVMADKQGNALRINQEFTRLFGYTQEETIGKTMDELIVPKKLQKSATLITEKVAKGEKTAFEAIRCRKDGETIAVSVLASPIIVGGKQIGTYGIYRNITERKMAEDQIKASLKEKEILLQEVHHRVKNNMQIISSLLNLQSRHIKDKESLGLFQSSQNRVKSMALIHERLYQSKDFTRIDVAEYVQNLTNHLFITYGISKEAIKLKINIKDIFLDINTAIPCALIINELVSNSLKHAFPNGKKGEIQISMHPLSKGEMELIVGDNGVGMPENANLKNTKSLGLYLVSMLAEDQLHGEIKLNKTEGTAYRFRLRVKQ
ncbi:MAG: PAS domain S-box protein, partial [Candidatus Aminicenantes bacterium]